MANNEEGRKDYVRRRFEEAEIPEDVKRISDELLQEGIPGGTVDRVKGGMKKTGVLPLDEASGAPVSMKRQFLQRLGDTYDVLTSEVVLQSSGSRKAATSWVSLTG